MFKIEPSPTFWTTASILVAGSKKPAEIEVEFRYLNKEARKVFFDSLPSKTNQEALGEIMADWRGVDASFSIENLGRVLDNYTTAADAFYEAFGREVYGVREKN
jgi:hypothetical protein